MNVRRKLLRLIVSLAPMGSAPLVACGHADGANGDGAQTMSASSTGSSGGAMSRTGPSSSDASPGDAGVDGPLRDASDGGAAMPEASAADSAIPVPTVIPYPSALTADAIKVTSLNSFVNNGLVLGNGELNGVVYTQGNDLYVLVGKNGFYDSRADTSQDPDMPIVDVAKGTFTGCQLCNPPSWDNYTYPSDVSVGIIKLAGVAGQNGWTGHALDLTHAVVTSTSGVDNTSARVLYQRNVLTFDTGRAVTLQGWPGDCTIDNGPGCHTDPLPAAQTGTMGSFQYLSQTIPADPDVPAETAYMVLGTSGTRTTVAVVDSRESTDPLGDAVALVRDTLAQADATIIQLHEAAWQQFWAASGVELDDPVLQRWWYRMVYFNRTWAKADGNAVGMKGIPDSPAGWHDALTFDDNSQQSYLSGAPENHPELIEPLIKMLTDNLPRAEWNARTNWIGSEGAHFHMDSWPFEPNPANCTTKNKHQIAYMPWGYAWGTDGHTSRVLWEYYKYTPDKAHLDKIWPLLKDFALFFCSLLEKCQTLNGVWHIGPAYYPENGPYGTYDTAYDINYITSELRATEEAAALESDTTTAARVHADLAKMPTWTTTMDPVQGAPIMAEWLGATLQGNDNQASVQASYPADLITVFSSQDLQDLVVTTINYTERIFSHTTNVVNMNLARARLWPNALLQADPLSNAKMWLGSNELPNGMFNQPGQGYYNSETAGISRIVTECLIQSVDDVIRVFPAWPASAGNAHFATLAAQGGFKVSSDFVSGAVTSVRIISTLGGNVSIWNPWSGTMKVVDDAGHAVTTTSSATAAKVNSFATTAGRTYTLAPAM